MRRWSARAQSEESLHTAFRGQRSPTSHSEALSSEQSATHEVAVALGSTLASTFLSLEPPRVAAHAERPVMPKVPRARYSLSCEQ